MRHLVLVLVSAVGCLSCVSCAMSGGGRKAVETSTPPPGCVPLGIVRGSDESVEVGKAWEHIQLSHSRTAAITDALERAAAKGATHATLGEPRRLDRGFSVEGLAYDCASRPALPAPAPAAAPDATAPAPPPSAALGCFKDTDCKGDRICRNHECVDP